jgi:hypothetical protein
MIKTTRFNLRAGEIAFGEVRIIANNVYQLMLLSAGGCESGLGPVRVAVQSPRQKTGLTRCCYYGQSVLPAWVKTG